ncbi:Glycogen synthase [Mycobacterium marinum]|nr:Glycogen synthase [Mycobacterium marinum]
MACSGLWTHEGCPSERAGDRRACAAVQRHAAAADILCTFVEGATFMKILMVSWEYPPVVIGGLGRHVHHLATALVAAGHEVVVLSRRPSGTDPSTHPSSDLISEGVRVIAAAQDPHEFSFGSDMMAWTLAMGHAMVRAGLTLSGPGAEQPWQPDIVHAHDWLVAHPAIALADYYDVPMVSTIHATEAGRHSGWVSGDLSRQVHAVESWLVRESDSLITCSGSMSDEITELFGPGLAETAVIRNGIDAARWPFAVRKPRTGPPELLYVGRLEYEKGVHNAIAALPRIRRAHPGTTLTIAGEGTQQDWLVEQARKHRVLKATKFLGHLEHAELLTLLHRADAAVFPSHYEPFGLVALEAAAAGTPLVTSNIGGLGEAVIDGVTGVSCPPRDVAALAAAVCGVLDDPAAAQQRARAARERLNSDFDWQTVAEQTAQVYLAAKRGERQPLPRLPIVEHALPDR